MNGWHKVRVHFCTCDTDIPWNERYRQLLRMRWYPASFSRPRTAFSFDVLETYHKLALQGKLNLYDFYHAIMQKSDNQGRLKTMVSNMLICVSRYGILMNDPLVVSIPRNLTLCSAMATSQGRQTWGWRSSDKRSFHHVPRVVRDRMPCLPPSWTKPSRRLGYCLGRHQVSISIERLAHETQLLLFFRWVYAQFIAVDANFKLKLKNRHIKDPELGSGWSYFVENSAYLRHVADGLCKQVM
jgi:hypothetical protein